MMKKRTLISMAALSALTATGCSGGSIPGSMNQGIINGMPVGDNDMPSVLASWNDGILSGMKGAFCSASLISPTAVLTAAHCVDPAFFKSQGGTPATRYFVTFFRNITEANKSISNYIEYTDFDVPPNYSPQAADGYDLAILHLKEPVVGHKVQQLATADIMAKVASNDQALIAGYGETKDQDTSTPGILNKGITTIAQIGTRLVSTGGTPSVGCHGDSGGPLFADKTDAYQIGVAARQAGVGSCLQGLVYTRVDANLDWIKSKVPDLGKPTQPAPDGGTMGDGGSSPSDAGTVDSGSGNMPDGSVGGSDSGAPVDSGVPSQPDAGRPTIPGGGGCSISGAGSSVSFGLPLLFALIGLALSARRRQN